MNRVRRNVIKKIINRIEQIQDDISVTLDEEQEYLENMPENLRESERADIAQDAIDNLENAYNAIEDIIDTLNEVIE